VKYPHITSTEVFDAIRRSKIIVAAADGKRMEVEGGNMFRVYKGIQPVVSTPNIDEAVERYNYLV
jgi:hypothetical protein